MSDEWHFIADLEGQSTVRDLFANPINKNSKRTQKNISSTGNQESTDLLETDESWEEFASKPSTSTASHHPKSKVKWTNPDPIECCETDDELSEIENYKREKTKGNFVILLSSYL